MTNQNPDYVALNYHVPNCACEVFDDGRVALSEACAGWTTIMQRHHGHRDERFDSERIARVRCSHREGLAYLFENGESGEMLGCLPCPCNEPSEVLTKYVVIEQSLDGRERQTPEEVPPMRLTPEGADATERKYRGWFGRRARKRCPHSNIRPVHGDEIIFGTNGYRLDCLQCGRLLDGPVGIAFIRYEAEVKPRYRDERMSHD